jgi:hypothetical protein
MAFTRRYLILLLSFGLIGSSAYAQTSVLAAKPINLRFTGYAITPPKTPVLFLPKAGADSKSIRFFSSERSVIYTYTGANPVSFFSEEPSTDPQVPFVRKLLGQATVPEAITRPLFIFFDNPAVSKNPQAEPYLVFVFDDSPSGLPSGSIVVLNISGFEFLAKINGQIMGIPAGVNAPIRVGRGASMELRTQFRQKYYQSYSSNVLLDAGERALILLLPPINPGSLEVQVRILKGQPDIQEGDKKDGST